MKEKQLLTSERLLTALIAVCIAFGGYFVKTQERTNDLMQMSINKQNELLQNLSGNCIAIKGDVKIIENKLNNHIEISELYEYFPKPKTRKTYKTAIDE